MHVGVPSMYVGVPSRHGTRRVSGGTTLRALYVKVVESPSQEKKYKWVIERRSVKIDQPRATGCECGV